MEFSQMRDGSMRVYDRGEWIGVAVPLATGWAFVGRWNDVLCTALTLDGLAHLIREDEEEEDFENGIFIESRG